MSILGSRKNIHETRSASFCIPPPLRSGICPSRITVLKSTQVCVAGFRIGRDEAAPNLSSTTPKELAQAQKRSPCLHAICNDSFLVAAFLRLFRYLPLCVDTGAAVRRDPERLFEQSDEGPCWLRSFPGCWIAKHSFYSFTRCACAQGYEVDALVIVDGTTESESQEKGKTIRKFKFSKVTTSEGEGDSGLRGSGAIVVIMCSGKCVPQEGKDWKLDLGAGNSTVEEKEAVKAGKSISVSRDGEKVTKTFTSSGFKIISPKKEGSFTSFLRERFWLQSRRIIHADGTPWGPVKDVPIIDLCTKADPTDGPPQKKIKREDGMPKIVEASATSFS